MLASYALLAFGIETTFSVPCILRYLADVSSFEEILTYRISEDCRQLCFWKRAKQPSPGSAISKEEICSLLSFVFAGGVLNSQGRDNPRTPKKNKGEAFPRPWAQQLEPGKKKDLRCFRTWAQRLDPVVDL